MTDIVPPPGTREGTAHAAGRGAEPALPERDVFVTATTAAYDAIAQEYRRSKGLPFRLHIEAYTLFELVGDPTGRSVLDLACGEGIYTREARRRGARVALGVDISGEMVRLAEESERSAPQGCRYVIADVAELPVLNEFDIVMGVYLLNYARTARELLQFCRVIHANLKPGGRFVGFNDNPANPVERYGSYRAYGFIKTTAGNRRPSNAITYTLFNPDGKSFDIVNYWLPPEAYETAFREAGFRSFEWCGPWLSRHGVRSHPEGFWDDFMSAPPLIGMLAVK